MIPLEGPFDRADLGGFDALADAVLLGAFCWGRSSSAGRSSDSASEELSSAGRLGACGNWVWIQPSKATRCRSANFWEMAIFPEAGAEQHNWAPNKLPFHAVALWIVGSATSFKLFINNIWVEFCHVTQLFIMNDVP